EVRHLLHYRGPLASTTVQRRPIEILVHFHEFLTLDSSRIIQPVLCLIRKFPCGVKLRIACACSRRGIHLTHQFCLFVHSSLYNSLPIGPAGNALTSKCSTTRATMRSTDHKPVN